MVGLPGSGKTTEAIRLAEQYHALRFTPDEWQYHLFGDDFKINEDQSEHDARHTKIEELIWSVAKEALLLGVDVILDFGCWAKEERDIMRTKAYSLGADFKIHYMACSKETLWERLQKRNQKAGEFGVFFISKENLEEWSKIFEPPTDEEIASYPVIEK